MPLSHEPNPASVRYLLACAGLLGGLAVAIGAFGAHALKDVLSDEARAWYTTGAHYQLVHAVAAAVCAALADRFGRRCVVAGWLLCAGATVFSATLYAMAFGAPRVLGAVTPVGGVLLIAGWATLVWAALSAKRGQ